MACSLNTAKPQLLRLRPLRFGGPDLERCITPDLPIPTRSSFAPIQIVAARLVAADLSSGVPALATTWTTTIRPALPTVLSPAWATLITARYGPLPRPKTGSTPTGMPRVEQPELAE